MQKYEKLSNISGSDSVLIMKAGDFSARKFNLAEGHIPMYIFGIQDFGQVKKKLLAMYGSDADIVVFDGESQVEAKLGDVQNATELMVLPVLEYIKKKIFTFGDLVEIIRRLRDDDGCPWDRAQTHKSIRGCAIEEAYELAEAIDLNSTEKMLEESGDVMLQGFFHGAIAEDEGEFTFIDMISSLCEKLVTRHTHIFGENKANSPEEALGFWEQAKAKEKKQKSAMDKINSVPVTFTALLKANKVQKYAAKAKFDFPTVEEIYDVLKSEIEEFKNAQTPEEKEMEGGDILFSVVNLLRRNGVDSEVALNASTTKFLRRFEYVMKRQEESRISADDVTLEQLESWYQEGKKTEKN